MAAFRDQFNPLSPRPLQSNDKALDGSDFTVYHVIIQMGLTTDQKSVGFVVAGPSSLPDPGSLWEGFKQQLPEVTATDVPRFVEFLRRNGYVQIQNSITLGLRY